MPKYELTDADISQDRKYRFTLLRIFKNPPQRLIAFCGLNPSTADWRVDDATIKREAGWTQNLGFDGFVKVNLWPFRATHPKDLFNWLKFYGSPSFHPDSHKFLVDYLIRFLRDMNVQMVLCAWGSNSNQVFGNWIKARGHDFTEKALAAELKLGCIEVNKDGSPAHPLYKKVTGCIHPWGLKSQGFANARF